MKSMASLAFAFFMAACLGNILQRDTAGALECVGLMFLSLWALNWE